MTDQPGGVRAGAERSGGNHAHGADGDDLSRLDATAQAELVRSGEASPVELVDAAIARIEKLNPQLNAVIHELFDRARAEAAGELPDGPFRGVPFLLKDLAAELEGTPVQRGHPPRRATTCSTHTQELTRRFQAGRSGHLRQDQHARVRHPAHHRAATLRPHPQPVGPDPHHRRLVGRLGGGGGVGHGPRRPRQRRRRLDPHPGLVLRSGRA